jgi:uncharacterized membrane protein
MTTARHFRPWLQLTPDRLLIALLAMEGFLLLSERFRWFAFNEHKGWTVLICLTTVGAGFVLMLLWFLVSLVLRLRFQYSVRSLLFLVVVVAIPCNWLAVELVVIGKPLQSSILTQNAQEFAPQRQQPGSQRRRFYVRFGLRRQREAS